MHTEHMADSEGAFSDKTLTDRACRITGCDGKVYVESWDSHDGAYTDHRYTCVKCGHGWWVDGPDS